MFIFGCKIVHVLCFAVTQLNLAYIVKMERMARSNLHFSYLVYNIVTERRKGHLFNDEPRLITYLKGKFNSK